MSAVAYVADGTGGLHVINYLPFDNQGQPPAVTIHTSAIDADPINPGVQVQEGASVPIITAITDDVQVRNAELLVNGEVVSNDVSFPFDFSAFIPSLSDGAGQLVIEIADSQKDAVLQLVSDADDLDNAIVLKDHEGFWRVLVADRAK